MNRMQLVLLPLVVAVGMLAYAAYQNALDAEQVAGVVVFLVIAVPVGIYVHRFSQKQRER